MSSVSRTARLLELQALNALQKLELQKLGVRREIEEQMDYFRAQEQEEEDQDEAKKKPKEPAEDEPTKDSVELLALEEGLQRLGTIEPELCTLVEMRFFGGLSLPEISSAIEVSQRTLERRWQAVRAWLYGEVT